MRFKGLASPIAGDVTEHTVFDLVPLAGTRWKVADFNRLADFIGELLELQLPEATRLLLLPPLSAVISRRLAVAYRLASMPPPLTNGGHSELGSVAADADTDPSFVLTDVIDTIRHRFPLDLSGKSCVLTSRGDFLGTPGSA